ncbi:glycosyltransferase family 2 protein [Priestia koreensis]|uniref:glycosyltransferase family 2 protein n=1 Tax=Priestia koreensis TaxID=284581 RepID=UPI0020414704|nr:glycosyltransferase [Priestia koreensis]MCM3005262.1 glycosyltransferase family 2 protein [Priestia koreensis]
MNLSVIIPACNEEDTLPLILDEVQKLHPLEIIVVVNGSTDNTKQVAEKYGCKVIEYKEKLGLNIGRSMGAKAAIGEVLLFLDGDIPVPHKELLPFIEAIAEGHDIALNDLSWTLKRKVRPHPVAVAKYALNLFMKQEQMSVQALTAVPFAMKRAAAEKLGYALHAEPPLAQVEALLEGMSIVAPIAVDVIYTNKAREAHQEKIENSPFPLSTSEIIGDHMLAIHHLIEKKGVRGGLTDAERNRLYPKVYLPKRPEKIACSAIIPVGEEKETIEAVITEVKKAGVEEIIVIANGSDDETVQIAKSQNVVVIEFSEALGHNIPRAIGAMCSSGDVCLFIDGDIVIKSEDLLPYIKAAEQGVDVALNDLSCLLDQVYPLHSVSAAKYFLNIALKRPDLTINTLTAVPHAIRRETLEKIGYDSLMVPPLAHVLAIKNGCKVEPVHFVDVARTNRIRRDHVKINGIAKSTERILGDHIEALALLLELTDRRGGFPRKPRRFDLLEEFLQANHDNQENLTNE